MAGVPPVAGRAGVITACGEALVDLVVDEDGQVTSFVGGAPVNTARAVARLGEPSTFLGLVSGDGLGRRIRATLATDGVRHGVPEESALPSPVAFAQVDHAGSATYRFLVDGTAAAALTPELALDRLDPGTRALHVGTLGLVLEPLVAATVALVRAAAEEQVVMLDPNCRPDLPGRRATFDRALAALLPRADLVKVSTADLAVLAPDRSPADAADALHRAQGATVLVTDGPGAVRVLVAGERVTVAVPPVDVVDTVGAGDAFSGAILAWWSRHGLTRQDTRSAEAVTAAAQFGVQAASWSCQRAGADPPFASEVGWS